LPRNLVMCAAEGSAAVCQGLAVVVLAGGAAPVASLCVLQAAVGLSRGFFYPAATGLVPSLIDDEEARRRANGLLGAAQATARLAAPPLAGVVVALAGAEAALALNAIAYTASALLLLGFPRLAESEQPVRALESVRRGWRELRSREWLWLTVVWFSALQCVAVAPLLVLGPEIARRSLGGSTGWGLVVGALGAGAAAGAGVAAVTKTRRPLAPAVAGYALYALPLLALAWRLPLPFVAAAAAVAGGSGAFFGATWFTVFQRNVPGDAISRVSAWDWEASLAGLPLGMLVAPQLADIGGVAPTLGAAAAVTAALTLVVARRPSLSGVRAR
jgi:MFS family permease